MIGFLNGQSPAPFAHLVAGFRNGLSETGFVEGRNVKVEYRWAGGVTDRLPELANELVQRKVAVLIATGGDSAAAAAKAATSAIPIVFSAGKDPVATGLVASLGRPGGNLTGVSMLTVALEEKRLGLLHELVPGANVMALLVSSHSAEAIEKWTEGARQASVRLIPVRAMVESDFETAFATIVKHRVDALVVSNDPFFNSRRDLIVALAARHRVPSIYEFREFTEKGGLMSYGASLADIYRQIGVYAGRILKGDKPGDLPVLQPSKFELVINLKTASALRLTIPQSLRLRADEIIE